MRAIIFILCLFSISCTSYDKKVSLSSNVVIRDINLAVSIPDEKFDYIDEHMTTSMASTALFGVVGYAAVAAYNETLDGEKREQFNTVLNSKSYAEIFHENVANKLKQYNIPLNAQSNIKLMVNTNSWGLRRINRDINMFNPFFDLTIIAMQDTQEIWNERKLFLSKEKRSFDVYKNNNDILHKDFDTLIKEASDNIAYNLIYK